MLIDDDKDCLEALALFLNRAGHKTYPYLLPEKAIEFYNTEMCEVVITDLKMSPVDGFQVLNNILLLNPRAKVIIISGCADDKTLASALGQGAFALLNKPINLHKLKELLEL